MVRNDLIIQECSRLASLKDLLFLLNRVKREEYGFGAHPFTMEQMLHFSDPRRNRRHYDTFAIPKRSGGQRTITAPRGMLKSFQKVANRVFQAFYNAPPCVQGFVTGRSVVGNAGIHVGMNYVFNSDLKDFFPSITQARIWTVLQAPPFNFPKRIASVLAGLCCTDLEYVMARCADGGTSVKGTSKAKSVLPQGSPASPILSNVVCKNLDRRLSGLAKRFGLRYSRYADDITFSSQHNVYQKDGPFMKEFQRIVRTEGFTINENKTRLSRRGQRQAVTGLTVNDMVNVPRKYVRDLDCLIHIWKRYGASDAYAKFLSRNMAKVSGAGLTYFPKMEDVLKGRLAYIGMVKGRHSPVYQRLLGKMDTVRHRTSLGTFRYVHSWRISEFESLTGFSLDMEKDPSGKWYCRFGPEGHRVFVCMSRWCRSRLTGILETNDQAALNEFKRMNRIGLCFDARSMNMEARCESQIVDELSPYLDGPYSGHRFFWMIFRRVSPNSGPHKSFFELVDKRVSKEGRELMRTLGLKPVSISKGPLLTNTDPVSPTDCFDDTYDFYIRPF